jgi:hypothetical protein
MVKLSIYTDSSPHMTCVHRSHAGGTEPNGLPTSEAQHTPQSADADALIRLAQQLCAGLGLQPDGLVPRVHAETKIRPASAIRRVHRQAANGGNSHQTAELAAGALEQHHQSAAPRQAKATAAVHSSCVRAGIAAPPPIAAPAADSELDSLDRLIEAEQCGPPTLQCLAAQALVPPEAKATTPAQSPPDGAHAIMQISPQDISQQLDDLCNVTGTPTDCSTSSLHCDVCSGGWAAPRPQSTGSSNSSGRHCSICAARRRNAAAAHAHATVQTSGLATPAGASPQAQHQHQQQQQQATCATADCWAQTCTTADAAVGSSRPSTAEAAGSRERRPAATIGGKRRCVPADDSAPGTRQQQGGSPADAGANRDADADALELPWAEQLRRPHTHGKPRRWPVQAVRRHPAGKVGSDEAMATEAGESCCKDARPEAGHQQRQRQLPATDGDLSSRMSALEAKVASWSVPQVQSCCSC